AVSAKISAVLRERPKTRWLLVPKGQRPRDLLDPRVVEVATLDEAAERIFGEELLTAGPIAGVNIEALIRRGVDLYEKASRFAEADTLFEVALRAIEAHRKELGDSTAHARDEILARWRLASSQVHRGKIEAALEAFSRTSELAEALWEKDAIEPRLYFGLQSNWAVALRDAWRYDEADALLTAILGEERRLRVGARELARTLGNRGELRTFAGRFENARVDLRASLEALRQAYPDEIPRALYTLGNLELASGNANAARRHYDAGLTRNKATQTGAARNEVFLRYGRARAYLAEGNAMAAIADCDRVLAQAHGDNAYPAQRLLALRGQARLRLGDHTTGHDDLQRAGDAVGDAGPLLAFGRRLAHAHLAIALLEENDDAHGARVAELVEGIAHTMDAVLGLPTDLAPKLRTQASALPQSALALAELLRHTIHLFPY
ncbi:MAG: hypothetical protein KAI47_26190, partial [Deltaproteobacteria bacterium]|nr:hypothetical protein [Deltaproteobacteria bacterium]